MTDMKVRIPNEATGTVMEAPVVAIWGRDSGNGFYVPVDIRVFQTILETLTAAVATESTLQSVLEALGDTPSEDVVNVFSENPAVSSGIESGVLSYTVPIGKVLRIHGVYSWADVDAEYFLRVGGVQRGGGRTSVANPIFAIEYGQSPVIASAGQTVEIRCLRQSRSALLPFKAQLTGVLNNG